jgi:cellobiose-specific phosphotransferase system component IIB
MWYVYNYKLIKAIKKRNYSIYSWFSTAYFLVTKMEKAAKEQGIESTIWAVSTDAADSNMAKVDVVLIGPQIHFQLKEMKKKGENIIFQ